MKSILLHAWTLYKKVDSDKYYIPYTHWVYLNEIVQYYDKICLLSPIKQIIDETSKFEEVSLFNNIEVYELPYAEGYIDAVKNFGSYLKAYKLLSSEYTSVYARYPIPFGWLQKYFFKNKRRIIHFVGDPIDTIVNNPNLSKSKKFLYQLFFKPEHLLFISACKGAEVYTNGFHLANRLLKQGISAKSLVSSTLNNDDFYFDSGKKLSKDAKIVYVGYLRKAKGVETIVRAFGLLLKTYPNLTLSIVGNGEMESDLKILAKDLKINRINFLGHIDNRQELNKVLRENDIFAFASLSEGSPRVILEAMANGLAVVSTPVGSLPITFQDSREILFANFNDADDFALKISTLINNSNYYNNLRNSSYNKVINYKIDNFLKEIFYEA